VPRKTQKIKRTRGQADFFYAMQKCKNAKNSMQCKNANAMQKSEKFRIASLFSFKKKTGKIID
jgi:hypothetical protein